VFPDDGHTSIRGDRSRLNSVAMKLQDLGQKALKQVLLYRFITKGVGAFTFLILISLSVNLGLSALLPVSEGLGNLCYIRHRRGLAMQQKL
jgi:hypothetical protein